MPIITIPKNQYPKKGEFMKVLVNDAPIYLQATRMTSSASYDEVWNSKDFDPTIHGFGGIIDPLTSLITELNK